MSVNIRAGHTSQCSGMCCWARMFWPLECCSRQLSALKEELRQSRATQLLKQPRDQFCTTSAAHICGDPSRPLCLQCYGHEGLEVVQQCLLTICNNFIFIHYTSHTRRCTRKDWKNKQITYKMSHVLYSTDYVTKHAVMLSVSFLRNPQCGNTSRPFLISIVSYATPARFLKPTVSVTKTY